MFSVGVYELVLIVVIAVVAALLACLRNRGWKWAAVAVVCAVVATVITPPDPLSTIFLGAVFYLFFLGGIRFGRRASVATA